MRVKPAVGKSGDITGARARAARPVLREGLDASLNRGLADARAGRFTPAEDVLARLKLKYAVTDYLGSSPPDED